MNTWHVITNSDGVIIGVYGEALLSEAQEMCRKIERQVGFFVKLSTIRRKVRPRAGEHRTVKEAREARKFA